MTQGRSQVDARLFWLFVAGWLVMAVTLVMALNDIDDLEGQIERGAHVDAQMKKLGVLEWCETYQQILEAENE